MSGSSNRRLVVDLSSRRVEVEPISHQILNEFIGGRGLNAFLLHELLSRDDPPDRPLVFSVGPATGTIVPGSGRVAAAPGSLVAGDGILWGPELRQAGYIQVVTCGRADPPVYISIRDEAISVRDARAISDEIDDLPVRLLSVGLRGLEAIAVRGTGAIEPACPDELDWTVRDAVLEAQNITWSRRGTGPHGRLRPGACFGCILQCWRYAVTPGDLCDVLQAVCDSMPVCGFAIRTFLRDPEWLARFLSAVTGASRSGEEIVQTGKRILTLEREVSALLARG